VDRILQAQEKAGLSAPDPAGRRVKAITILKKWDGLATTGNQALPILSAFLEAAQQDAVRPSRRQRRGKAKASGGPANLAALSPTEVIATLDNGLAALRKRFGTGPVTWGMLHRIARGKVNLPMPGSGSDRGVDPFTCLFMAGAKKVTDGKFLCDSGSSWMQFVVYRQGKVEARTVLPFGNSNDPDSSHYADQTPLFAKRQLKQALLARSEIEAAATSRKVLMRYA
jgi:acyl-homoserine-lactone acylase